MAIAKQQSITDPSSFINPTAATIDEDEVKGQMSAMEKVNELWENAVELPKCREYMVDRLKASLGIEVGVLFVSLFICLFVCFVLMIFP